jgi:hypothetical protein
MDDAGAPALHRRSKRIPAAHVGWALLGSILALAWAHGARILGNLETAQWEDALFFRYTHQHVHTLVDCFRLRGPYPGLYRPLTTNLFYFLGLRFFGERLLGYHLILAALVIANAVLLHRIAYRLLPAGWALLAPLLWASRLANVEVVTHTCEFQGLCSTFWLLVAIDAFSRDSGWLSTVAAALALLSKETALVLPAILLTYHLTVERKQLRVLVGPLAVSLVWIAGWLALRGEGTGFTLDLTAPNLVRNLAAYLLSFSNLLVRPLENWIMPPAVAGLAGRRAVEVSMACLIGLDLLALLRGNRVRIATFGCTWWLLATLPVAPFQRRLFMRYAYFGHAGLAIAVSATGALLTELARQRWVRRRASPEKQPPG